MRRDAPVRGAARPLPVGTVLRIQRSFVGPMTLIGNILWLIFGGLIASFLYAVSGLLWCLTVIGIPFGLQLFKYARAMLAPFGKEMIAGPKADSPGRLLLNLIWIVFFGWEIALGHVAWAAVLAITVVGIPFALQHVKLIPLALFPFGHEFRAR